ncbi:PAQR family membrane homeostasis protein TrhA [Naumannella cuiyingiana]|uniref:Hemolysin III n=1 Tax=Naumannella cuiyingiana TaxID=1347891 RepID=A0A7Z0DAB8_9ACTN|nr:hemolysin III family protein [Naumannella cuiyingiana]NYI71876.1 hemolysin III [Naumannella cuiyingiana]
MATSSPGLASEIARPLKPKLRGWLHAAMLPLSLAAGILLVVLAPSALGKIGGAVFLAASVLLFGTSALYHRFYWGARGEAVLRRMDHSNIFVFIAATYTPMALLLLDGTGRWVLLGLVWGAAIIGLLSRVLWLGAPRWFYTLLYLAIGWAAVGWLKPFWDNGGPLVFALIVAGGLLYSVGALVYARKRPDPSPRWFGFHEIFHACTVAAFACHYAAISVATYA